MAESRPASVIIIIRRVWMAYERTIVAAATVLLAVTAAWMLTRHVTALVGGQTGAIDLKYYYSWVGAWFDGAPFYTRVERPEYPPASLPLLWPLVGWLSLGQARALWAVVDALSLIVLSVGIIRATGVGGAWPRACAVCLLASMLPTGVAIGNGQLILHVLPLVLAGVFVVRGWPPGWIRDAAGACLIVAALVKPTITVPFLWIVVFSPGGWRPLALAAAGYIALTVFAASFQHQDAWSLWSAAVVNGQRTAASPDGNVHFLMRVLGVRALMLPASAAMLLACGAWTYRHRHQDVWVLLAVAALVARLWTYHRIYDGVLMVIAEVALVRLASRRFLTDDLSTFAGALVAVNVLAFLPPGPDGPLPLWAELSMQAVHVLVTVLDLAFLILLLFAPARGAGARVARRRVPLIGELPVMDVNARFRVNTPKVVHEPFEDEVVVVNLDTGRYYCLQRAGVAVWLGLVNGWSIGEIASQLDAKYLAVEGEIRRAVGALISELEREQLVSLVAPDAGGRAHAQPGTALDAPAADRPPFESPTLQVYTDMQDLLLLDPIHEVDEAGWPIAADAAKPTR